MMTRWPQYAFIAGWVTAKMVGWLDRFLPFWAECVLDLAAMFLGLFAIAFLCVREMRKRP